MIYNTQKSTHHKRKVNTKITKNYPTNKDKTKTKKKLSNKQK